LIPNFLSATDRARLKSDIQSARVIQSAIELQDAENITPVADSSDVSADILPTLSSKGYLSSANSSIQTASAKWVYTGKKVSVDISNCSSKVKGEIYNALSAAEKAFVIN
jgi:type II secretory pathway pseudopilin PulG